MIPIAKIASPYLLLGMEDIFWHMWRCHVTYVVTSNVHDGGQNALFLPLFVNRDIFWCRCEINKVGVVFNIVEVLEFKNGKINHVTLTDDLEIWKPPTNWPFINRLVIMIQSWSWCLFWHFWVRDLRKTEINHVTLTVDLQNWGHKYILHVTFCISGCMYSKDKISVPILTFLRSGISKKTKSITWPWQLTLNVKVKLTFIWPFLSLVVLHDTDLILVSILTNSRSVISNQPKLVTWSWRLTFKVKVKLAF